MLFSGKTVLVTGASRGIGAATAKLFGEQGAKVAVNYFSSEQAADSVVSDIVSKGGSAQKFQADITNSEQVNKMIEQVTAAFGEIDILVLNAGMNVKIAPFVNSEWQDLENKVLGELKSVYHCCKAVVPQMTNRKDGCIIAVSSGLSKSPGHGFGAHSVSKAAVDAYVKSLALELGPSNIRVNVISPGFTLTDATQFMPEEAKQQMLNFVPLRRHGLPEDVAGAIIMMASDFSKFISGAYLPVSGGSLML